MSEKADVEDTHPTTEQKILSKTRGVHIIDLIRLNQILDVFKSTTKETPSKLFRNDALLKRCKTKLSQYAGSRLKLRCPKMITSNKQMSWKYQLISTVCSRIALARLSALVRIFEKAVEVTQNVTSTQSFGHNLLISSKIKITEASFNNLDRILCLRDQTFSYL